MNMNDIWALAFADNSSADCLAKITGLAKVKNKSYDGHTERFWVCISKGSTGKYEGEVLDHEEISDE